MAEILSDTMTKLAAGQVESFQRLGGDVLSASAVITPSATQASGDTLSMTKLPSNAIIKDGYIQYGAGFSAATVDVGLFFENDSTNDDADVLIDGADIGTAAGRTALFTAGTGVETIANQNKQLWEIAGFTSDPGGLVVVKATVKASLTTTDGLKLVVDYTSN